MATTTSVTAVAAAGANNNNNSHYINNNNNSTIAASVINGYRHAHSRKKSLSVSIDDCSKHTNNGNGIGSHNRAGGANAAVTVTAAAATTDYEGGELPAKFLKVYNGLVTTEPANVNANAKATAAAGQLQLSQVVGGGSLVVSPSYTSVAATASNRNHHHNAQLQKVLLHANGNSGSNGISGISGMSEIGRLPGGAELNILPSNNSKSGNANTSNGAKMNGTMATALYHANGKLTLLNGGHAACGSNGISLKDNTVATAPLQFANATSAAGLTALANNVSNANNNNNNNGLQYAGNFAQLLAATSIAGATQPKSAERINVFRLAERRHYH